MLNIVIFHHFDYPEGMATTKRFQFFADYFHTQGCKVTFVLKINQVNAKKLESGTHKGLKYYKIFFKNYRKYPLHYDRRQHKTVIETINNQFDPNSRNIILTGGIIPEFFLVIRKLLPRWELFCDYLEDRTAINTIFSDLKEDHLIRFLKLKIVTFIYSPLVKYAENFMFQKAKGISAISPFLYKKAKDRAQNVINIPITANQVINLNTKRKNEPITLFFAGTGSLKDGLDIIAKAFSNISSRYDVSLKISGKISKDGMTLLKHYCKNLDKVTMLGFISDANYYLELGNADIMLMTRNNTKFSNAGFPFKLGEYLATGKPVITTRVSGIDQYLEHKKNALFIEPGNAYELEKEISFLINNPEFAISIGKEGQKVFEEHFLAEKNCKKLFDFISNVK